MAKILTEEELDAKILPLEQSSFTPEVIPTMKQKINNILQKEDAMHHIGLTRRKYLLVIIEALEATVEVMVDVKGVDNLYYKDKRIEPDFEKRKWGAEQAAKLFGDYIQHVDANVRVTHSVEDLINTFEKAKKRN